MKIEELEQLNIIKSVEKNNGKYSVNNAPYTTATKIRNALLQQKNIIVDEDELINFLNSKTKQNKILEKDIQAKIHKWYGGQREVVTPVGLIDLLTTTELIEVKKAKDWKHSLGQVISYSKYYPQHKRVLYIFGECPKNLHECYQLCVQNNVELRCEFW